MHYFHTSKFVKVISIPYCSYCSRQRNLERMFRNLNLYSVAKTRDKDNAKEKFRHFTGGIS